MLLALTGTTEAQSFLAERISAMDPADPHRALGQAVGTMALHDELLDAFGCAVRTNSLGDVQGLLEGAVPAFAAQDDPRLRDAVATALRDPTVAADVRGDLVYWVLPHDPGLAPVLIELLDTTQDPELTRLTALALQRAAGRFAARPGPWRQTMTADVGRRLLDANSHHVRAAGLDLLLAHESPPPPQELLSRALQESDVVMQRHLVGALPKGGPATANSPALQLLGGDSQVRRSVHFWIASGDEPARWLEGLANVSIDDDLQPYCYALLRDPPRTDPSWRPVQQLALAFSRDERPRFRQRASELLGGLPGASSSAALIRLLDDDVIWVRTTAADALARGADAGATKALIAAAEAAHRAPSRDSYLVGELLQAVGATRETEAVAYLAALLPHPDVGAAARYALSEAGPAGGEALATVLDQLLSGPQTPCQELHRTVDVLARLAPGAAAERLAAVRARTCEEREEDWLPGVIESWERAKAIEPITALTEHPSRTVRFAAMTARGRLLREFAIPLR